MFRKKHSLFLCLVLLLIASIVCLLYTNKKEMFITSDKTTIVFSLTCHECPVCVSDLICNINHCFPDFNNIILISTTESMEPKLMSEFDKNSDKQFFKNVKIVTVRDDNKSIWGNIELFQQHVYNMKFIIDNDVQCDYFWFTASNEYFFKKVDASIFNNINSCKRKTQYSEEDINGYYDEYVKERQDSSEWWGHSVIRKSTHFINAMKESKMKIHVEFHESIILSKEMMEEIYYKYKSLQIYENMKEVFPMEEIFVISYLNSYFDCNSLRIYCKLINYDDSYKNLSPEAILDKVSKEDGFVSLKPVKRNMDCPLRKLIKNKIGMA